jgi:hypothetical protein
MSDPVMAMVRMPAPIAVKVVSHVDQFFGNHDLHGSGERLVNSAKVDEHRMIAATADKAVRPTVGGRQQPANPMSVHGPAGRHSKVSDR